MSNPILDREVKLLLRQPGLLERLWAIWLLMAVVVVVMWPVEGQGAEESRRWIFNAFSIGQLCICLLLAPSVTAPLITDEKENNRFAMLFASLLTPLDVLMGKWLASLIVLLMILLSGLPFLTLVLVLGSVSWVEIVQVYLVCLVALCQSGMIGLYWSCRKDKTYDALLSGYAWLLVLSAFTWIPGYLLGSFTSLAPVWAVMRSFSPFSAMVEILSPEVLVVLGGLPSSWSLGELWGPDLWLYLLLGMASSAVLFGLCLKQVFLLPLGHEGRGGGVGRKRRLPLIFDPNRRKKPFGVGSLIFVNELRCRLFGYVGNLIRGIYLGLFASIALVILVSLNVDTLSLEAVKMAALFFQMGMMLLLGPSLSAPSVSGELESGTLEMLRMTPVSAWKFWKGKVQAIVMWLSILLLSTCPIYLLVGVLGQIESGDLFQVPRMIVLQGVLLVWTATVGVWCSTLVRSTQKAVGWAYVMVLSYCLMPCGAFWLVDGASLSWIESLSPFLVVMEELKAEGPNFSIQGQRHLGVMGVGLLLMLLHSLWLVSRRMRQAQ